MDLCLDPFMEQDASLGNDYELFSVVIHRGGAHGGHYHALIKDIDSLGTWNTPVSSSLFITLLNGIKPPIPYHFPLSRDCSKLLKSLLDRPIPD